MKTVYFMRPIGQPGPVKIGCSKNPAHRLRDVEIWSPIKLELAAHALGDHVHENILHHRFADSRLHGEWFAITPELDELIRSVAETGALPDLDIPKGARGWKEYRENAAPLPRRDNFARMTKCRITKKVREAERRAYGFGDVERNRPAEIDAIIRGYQGFAAPMPSDAEFALSEEYIARLAEMPAADRSHQAWRAWISQREEA